MPKLEDASAFKVGSSNVDKLYVGSTKVWPRYPMYKGRTSGAASTGTSQVMTIPAGTQAGDLMVMGLAGVRGTNTAFTTSMTQSWTKIGELFRFNVSSGALLSIYAKVAGASESNPTWSLSSANIAKAWVVERWANVLGLPDVITPLGTSTAGAQTLQGNTVTAVSGSVILSFLGLRTSTGGIDPVWGGGAVSAFNTDSGQTAGLYNATEKADSGTRTHEATFTNNQGAPVQIMGSIVLKPAA